MAFAFIAALAHGWLHDAHAATPHFAGQSEYCTLDKTAAVVPEPPAPPPPTVTVVDHRPLPAAAFIGVHRNQPPARAPPSLIA